MYLKLTKNIGRTAQVLAVLWVCGLMSGCDLLLGLQAGGYAQKYTSMTQANRETIFKEGITPLSVRDKSRLTALVFGETAAYISPEQQAAFFTNDLSFMWSIGAMALGSGLLTPGNDEFLLALKDYSSSLPAQMKALTTTGYVEQRLAAIKVRFGVYYKVLDVATLQDLVWNEASFQAAMADNAYATQLIVGAAGVLEEKAEFLRIQGGIFLPLTTTGVTQPPS